jgi:hypothetical protein
MAQTVLHLLDSVILFQLFGPRWNTLVPRFAANLGFSPLEPIRASQSSPTPLEPAKESPVVETTAEVGSTVGEFSNCYFCQVIVSVSSFGWL